MKQFLQLVLLAFAWAASAQDYNLTITHGGKPRTFILHSPCATFNCTGKKIPLVFAFHGLTETGAAIKNYSSLNAVADTAGFAVIYADGISNRWNVGLAGAGEDDLGFANAMIDYMITNSTNCDSNICAELDTNRIYSCGMSNGGFFSYLLACQLSHRIAAIASVTGTMSYTTYDSCNAQRAVPIFQIHGTTDPIVPYGGSTQSSAKSIDDVLAFWVSNNGCSGSPVTTALPNTNTTDGCTVESIHYQNCAQSSEVLLFKITNGGHTWPSMANVQYPEFIVGKTNKDVHASQEIWRFFNRHRLDNTTALNEAVQRDKTVRFYPNPATDVLHVELNQPGIFYVADVYGKVYGKHLLDKGLNKLNLSALPAGVYVGLAAEHGASKNFRFIKN